MRVRSGVRYGEVVPNGACRRPPSVPVHARTGTAVGARTGRWPARRPAIDAAVGGRQGPTMRPSTVGATGEWAVT